jgi:hypothetical protein
VTRDDAIAEEPVALAVGGARLHERVELDERPGVEQQLDPLPRGELSAGMLLVDPVLSPTETRFRAQRSQAVDTFLVRRHGCNASVGIVFAQGQRQ